MSVMHAQRQFRDERNIRRTNMSSPVQRNHFTPSDHGEEVFSRIILVPATGVRKITSNYASEVADVRSTGHRQPTEHPHDQPNASGVGSHSGATRHHEDGILSNLENLSVRTPSENISHAHQTKIKYPVGVSSVSSRAMLQSNRRVAEWESHPPDTDNDRSFVIDQYSDTLASEVNPLAAEGHRNMGRLPLRSSSFDSYPPNDQGMVYAHKTSPDDTLSLPRSEYEEIENSSDDETGLPKSLSFIQKPPEVDGSSCSRQNSNGSQSSLDSSLSFHTVYPSGDNFFQHKASLQRTRDRNRYQHHQATSPPPQQTDALQNAASARPPGTASTEQYFGRSQSQPGPSGYNRSAGQSGVRQINQRADEASRQDHEQKPTSVFITYAEERHDKNFKKLVLQLTKTLLSNGIQVRLDMLESTLMSMSVSSWLDDNIQKCDFVVVCVSPSYKSEVEQQITAVTPDPHSLHTRYIYNRLLTEYIQNGSLNYRFIPVLIGGANRKDLPSLCLDTHVYEWPKDFEAIIYRLFKKEKYIQPIIGKPPRCTVETYDSYDEKVLNAQSSNRGYR